jgi:hypothetical protein
MSETRNRSERSAIRNVGVASMLREHQLPMSTSTRCMYTFALARIVCSNDRVCSFRQQTRRGHMPSYQLQLPTKALLSREHDVKSYKVNEFSGITSVALVLHRLASKLSFVAGGDGL